MEPIPTTACFRINQCRLKVVFTQEPAERTHCARRPLGGAVDARGSEAGCNRRRCLDRLLVEGCGALPQPAEALAAYRSEVSGWRSLKRHEPAQGPQTNLDIARRSGGKARLDQRLGQTRIIVRKQILEPEPVFGLRCREQRHETISQYSAQAPGEAVIAGRRAIGVQPKERESPRAGG